MLQGIEDAGFEKCTPVQEQALPESLRGLDIIVQSQTGTGKTAVFISTIYNRLIVEGKERPGGARALVMAPTRELALQIDTEAKKLAVHLPFRSIAIYGGVEYEKQISALKEGVDLVVATPGRMIDLYKSKSLSLKDIEIFVVDEADRMFDMGFAPDISYIASRLPKGKDRQTMLFSATIDENVHRLASRYMKPEPVVVEIEPEQVTVDKIDQKVLYPSNDEKLTMLMALLRRPDVERAIIFANMKRTVEMLEWKLSKNDFLAMGLTGDVSQSKRQRIIDDMKAGKLKILVATDVVARGLHVEDITHVYNYDLPQEAASYVHRIGRTARAGKSGKAYSLVCEDHAFNLPEIEKYIERKIPAEWIDEAEMLEDKAGPYRSRPRSAPTGKGGKGARGASSRSSAKPSAKSSVSGGKGRSGSGSSGGGKGKSGTKAATLSKGSDEAKAATDSKTADSAQSSNEASPEKPSSSSSRPGRRRSSRGPGGRGFSGSKDAGSELPAEGADTADKEGAKKDGEAPARRRSRSRSRRPGGASQKGGAAKGGKESGDGSSPDSAKGSAPSSGGRGRAKPQGKRAPGVKSRRPRAGTGAATGAAGTGVGSVGNSLIESQTGGAVASPAKTKAAAATPKKGVLKRILNVFGKK